MRIGGVVNSNGYGDLSFSVGRKACLWDHCRSILYYVFAGLKTLKNWWVGGENCPSNAVCIKRGGTHTFPI